MYETSCDLARLTVVGDIAAMPDEDAKPVAFPIRRILLDMSPPKAAHSFVWVRVGDQFMLEVGYFDLKVWSEMINRSETDSGAESTQTANLDLFITDRFVMDIGSAGRLVDVMKSLTAEYEKILAKINTLTALEGAQAHAK